MKLTVAVCVRPASAPPAQLLRVHPQQRALETRGCTFQFDGLYQDEPVRLLMESALPLVETVLDGNSAALVCVGAERTGKSFALFGTAAGETGLAVRALCDLVSAARARGDAAVGLRVWLLSDETGKSVTGARQPLESRYDLLAPRAPVAVPDVSRVTVLELHSVADVQEALERALGARQRY
ncbi:hypothetical protein T492DRAFT_858732 [Pavlovales sp. CCMP2436]|nr:hypothetical protein T492DRAFT_858732 [Pavlovales sp. CCMP2436]